MMSYNYRTKLTVLLIYDQSTPSLCERKHIVRRQKLRYETVSVFFVKGTKESFRYSVYVNRTFLLPEFFYDNEYNIISVVMLHRSYLHM